MQSSAARPATTSSALLMSCHLCSPVASHCNGRCSSEVGGATLYRAGMWKRGRGFWRGGGGGHIRVLAVSTPSHNLRLPPSQQAWARDVGVSQKEPIVGVPHRDCPSHPAATSSMFAASCGHRYGPIETNRKIWQCHLALPPPSLAARTQGGPIRSIRGVCTLKAH